MQYRILMISVLVIAYGQEIMASAHSTPPFSRRARAYAMCDSSTENSPQDDLRGPVWNSPGDYAVGCGISPEQLSPGMEEVSAILNSRLHVRNGSRATSPAHSPVRPASPISPSRLQQVSRDLKRRGRSLFLAADTSIEHGLEQVPSPFQLPVSQHHVDQASSAARVVDRPGTPMPSAAATVSNSSLRSAIVSTMKRSSSESVLASGSAHTSNKKSRKSNYVTVDAGVAEAIVAPSAAATAGPIADRQLRKRSLEADFTAVAVAYPVAQVVVPVSGVSARRRVRVRSERVTTHTQSVRTDAN